MRTQGRTAWEHARLGAAIIVLLLMLVACAATPSLSRAAQDPSASAEMLPEIIPGVVSARRARVRKRARKGISLTPSSNEAHWACPEESCEAIIDPTPLLVKGNGKGRFRLPDGPLLEGSGEKGGLDPEDLQSAYEIPTTGGENQTIALVDAYGYPTAEEDLAKYRERYGLPPCTKANGCFRKVNQQGEEGNYPKRQVGWETESALDLDMVSAACPHCHIMLAEATSSVGPDLRDTVELAAHLGATEISNSYGSAEQNCGFECEEEAAAYEQPGILITVASGDSGYDNHEAREESPNFPAGLPSVVAVGGTVLHRAKNARGWTEEAWSGGGSGCSKLWAKPIWQTDSACAKRMSVDVAANASCESPDSTYAAGQKGWQDICGTSAAAPLVAAIEAHATAYSRSLPGAEAFYEDPGAFYDVSAGNNGTCTPPAGQAYFCNAQDGYDGPTGNGSPNGPLELSGPPAPNVTTGNASAASGEEATLNGKIAPQGESSSYHFEYGTSTAYGTSMPVPDASAGSGHAVVSVSQTITGLKAATVYHFRLVATNADGTSYGAASSFLTTSPSVTSVSSDFGPTDGNTTVTIAGSGFAGAFEVKFGTREAQSFTVESENSISAVTPQGAGPVDVTVTTAAGTSATNPGDRFIYDKVGPVLDWGFNESQLGDGAYPQSDVPVEVDELPEATGLAAGGTSSLALMADGTVMAWGENRLGSLGDGNEHTSFTPVQVCAESTEYSTKEVGCPSGPYLTEVTAIAAGGFQGLALLKNGTVAAWGGNGRGQLGIDTEAGNSSLPLPVCAAAEYPCKPANYLKEVIAVAGGFRFSLALLKDGSVMAWGENNQGELATGKSSGPEKCSTVETIDCSRVPRPIAKLSEVTAIAAGTFHALALRANGQVEAWGADSEGELGDGLTQQSDTPTPVCAVGEPAPCAHELEHVRGISAGESTSTAVLQDGLVLDWGTNAHGQLGDGSLTGPETCGGESCSTSPVAVRGLSGVQQIASGAESTTTIALSEAGELFSWGGDGYGQLGDGLTAASDVPVHVCPAYATEPCPAGPYLSGEVAAIASGGFHELVSLKASLSTINSLTPNSGSGAGGTRVTLKGENLLGVSAVHFGTKAAAEFEVKSASEVVAVSPPGSGTVNVTVATPEGGSHIGLADEFTYETGTVTSVSPATGSGTGGTSVTITGTKLLGATAVHFGSTAAGEFEVRSASEVVAVSPSGRGVVDVTVTTPEGSTAATSADQFVYQDPPAASTEPATGVHLDSAVLNAEVDPEGAAVSSCRFEYGRSESYGSSVPCTTMPGAGSAAVAVSATVSQLEPDSTYHFRIFAGNSQGPGYGADQTFTTPASELPELGRCVKLAHATGAYSKSTCTTLSSGQDTGKYEWQAGPGARRGFSASTGGASFELAGITSGGAALKCTTSSLNGQYAGSQSASLSIALNGCSTELDGHGSCHAEGDKEGEVTALLHARLGIIAGKKPALGWSWQPAEGDDIASVMCSGGAEFSIDGAMIGSVSKVDKPSSSFSLAFAFKSGMQTPESFQDGPSELPFISDRLGSFPLVFTLTATLDGEEPLELKAVA